MSAIFEQMTNKAGDDVFPYTRTDGVFSPDGTRLDNEIVEIKDKLPIYLELTNKFAIGLSQQNAFWLDSIKENGDVNRFWTNNNTIGYQEWKNGVLTNNPWYIRTKPVIKQITFSVGTTNEPQNCNVINFGNFAIVNITGYTTSSGGIIAELDFEGHLAATRANVRNADDSIFYINPNDNKLRLSGTTTQGVYAQLIVPLI